MEDTLKVNYDDETRSISLEWDPEDPNWKFLNHLTEEEISTMIKTNLEDLIYRHEQNDT